MDGTHPACCKSCNFWCFYCLKVCIFPNQLTLILFSLELIYNYTTPILAQSLYTCSMLTPPTGCYTWAWQNLRCIFFLATNAPNWLEGRRRSAMAKHSCRPVAKLPFKHSKEDPVETCMQQGMASFLTDSGPLNPQPQMKASNPCFSLQRLK